MIEYIEYPLSRHFLTKMIKEEQRKRMAIVSQIVNHIKANEIGVHEYGSYQLSIEHDRIQIVTPDKIYVKLLHIH